MAQGQDGLCPNEWRTKLYFLVQVIREEVGTKKAAMKMRTMTKPTTTTTKKGQNEFVIRIEHNKNLFLAFLLSLIHSSFSIHLASYFPLPFPSALSSNSLALSSCPLSAKYLALCLIKSSLSL